MKTIFSAIFSVFSILTILSQNRFWTQIDEDKITHIEKLDRDTKILKHQVFALDLESLKNKLSSAVSRGLGIDSELIIDFPNANGELQRYKIYEASVMHPELSAKHPDIKSYIGVGLDDRTATIRFSTTIFGFHGMISSGKTQTTYIDPYTKDLKYYTIYSKSNIEKPNNAFRCLVQTENKEPSGVHFSAFGSQETQLNGSLRKFRLALACTTEYATFHVNAAGFSSGTVAQKKAVVLAAMNVSMTRINGIYERDLSITMELVPNNENIIFITSDNFNNYDPDVLINQSQSVITSTIGSSNFDIGHTVSTGAGGLAMLDAVCKTSQKARGVTGSSSPVGDPFDIDYISHEMGHQFGADHTFNNSCSWNWNPSTAVETGSGSTIMAYAGICPPNVQNNSSNYFHTISLYQIEYYITSQATCSQNTNNGNTKPVINNIPNKTIPKGTAFVLRGNGSDANGDALTYCWEQIDIQSSTQPPSNTSTAGPNFRSLPPSDSPNRYMPVLSSVLAGNLSPTWEVVPNVGRNMKFALTVRDNNPNGGEFARKNITITVSGTAGPFKVTSQNTNNTYWQKNTQQTITWDVAGTTNAPINTSNVNILLSTNGGASFDYVLASNTPNDGSETITVPNETTANARIMVEAVNNIFYAVNSSSFMIGETASINNFSLSDFNLYPNPNNGSFSVEFSSNTAENIHISVFDSRGRKIFNQSYSNNGSFSQNIDLKDVEAGIYLVVIKDGENSQTRKIAVK